MTFNTFIVEPQAQLCAMGVLFIMMSLVLPVLPASLAEDRKLDTKMDQLSASELAAGTGQSPIVIVTGVVLGDVAGLPDLQKGCHLSVQFQVYCIISNLDGLGLSNILNISCVDELHLHLGQSYMFFLKSTGTDADKWVPMRHYPGLLTGSKHMAWPSFIVSSILEYHGHNEGFCPPGYWEEKYKDGVSLSADDYLCPVIEKSVNNQRENVQLKSSQFSLLKSGKQQRHQFENVQLGSYQHSLSKSGKLQNSPVQLSSNTIEVNSKIWQRWKYVKCRSFYS